MCDCLPACCDCVTCKLPRPRFRYPGCKTTCECKASRCYGQWRRRSRARGRGASDSSPLEETGGLGILGARRPAQDAGQSHDTLLDDDRRSSIRTSSSLAVCVGIERRPIGTAPPRHPAFYVATHRQPVRLVAVAASASSPETEALQPSRPRRCLRRPGFRKYQRCSSLPPGQAWAAVPTLPERDSAAAEASLPKPAPA